MEVMVFNVRLTPHRFFYRGETFPISRVDEKYIITNYKVYLQEGCIRKIIINAKHPNAHPDTKEFCLDDRIKKVKYNENLKKFIEMVMCNFYLDDCYFKPWLDFDWEE